MTLYNIYHICITNMVYDVPFQQNSNQTLLFKWSNFTCSNSLFEEEKKDLHGRSYSVLLDIFSYERRVPLVCIGEECIKHITNSLTFKSQVDQVESCFPNLSSSEKRMQSFLLEAFIQGLVTRWHGTCRYRYYRQGFLQVDSHQVVCGRAHFQ